MTRSLIAMLASASLGMGCHLVFGIHEVETEQVEPDAPVESQNWASISVGVEHTCALKTDASAWCWGRNDSGQLGHTIGDIVEADRPVRVDGETWSEIATSAVHTCGIRTDDTLWCWGADVRGSLGSGQADGTSIGKPTQVIGAWRHVAIEAFHSCAISTTGTLSCWGSNQYGQLGNGLADASVGQAVPLAINDPGPWASVAVGLHATCAIKEADRTLWCWGRNDYGGLGIGSSMPIVVTPSQVAGPTTWRSISMGVLFACGITTEGTASCMGFNGEGQLGDDTTTEHTIPVAVDHGSKDWVEITAGWFNACARRADGSTYCWGSHRNAQLAVELGPLAFRSVPVMLDTPPTIAVSSGAFTTCAIQADRNMWCAGNGANGQRGNGTGTHLVPTMTLGPQGVRTVTMGDNTVCVVDAGAARCWGDNTYGGIGDGTTFDRASPVTIPSPSGGAWSMIAPGRHSCGVSATGVMYCWGDNSSGSLGNGTLVEAHVPTPTSIPETLSTQPTWKSATVGEHSCGLNVANSLFCWGSNSYGEIGRPATTNPQLIPFKNNGIWYLVDALDNSTCAVDSLNRIQCFGFGELGDLGDGMSTSRSTPALVAGLPTGYSFVSGGAHHGCVAGAPMHCWGNNAYGQLGDQSTTTRPSPISIPGQWGKVATGKHHTCAVNMAKELWCFGENTHGQLGDGTFHDHHSPTRVGMDVDWQQAFAGSTSTCAIKTDGSVWCWGAGGHGEMGDGTAWSATHTLVIVP